MNCRILYGLNALPKCCKRWCSPKLNANIPWCTTWNTGPFYIIHMTIMQTQKTNLQIHMNINELWAPLLAIPLFTPGLFHDRMSCTRTGIPSRSFSLFFPRALSSFLFFRGALALPPKHTFEADRVSKLLRNPEHFDSCSRPVIFATNSALQ
jgi:hypothetical protein